MTALDLGLSSPVRNTLLRPSSAAASWPGGATCLPALFPGPRSRAQHGLAGSRGLRS